jgi:hypothetical protein
MPFLSDKKKEALNDFTKFVKDELGIKKMPKIAILNHREGLKTTASYDYKSEQKKVSICGKNRALVDIMRSLAHELVHHKQFEQGRLKVQPPDIGGEIEDEANAKAGQFIKMFARKTPNIYDLDEQEMPPVTATPTATATTAYPEVGHWESGVTRGSANQVATTSKWSEVVGSKLTRGKANPLK